MSQRPRTDEGPLIGAVAALTLYGLAAIIGSLFHVNLVPEAGSMIALLMVSFLIGGFVVGTLTDGLANRR